METNTDSRKYCAQPAWPKALLRVHVMLYTSHLKFIEVFWERPLYSFQRNSSSVPDIKLIDGQLRSQIEAAAAKESSTESFEQRIATALCRDGRFQGPINAGELAIILRNVVYTLFSRHKFAGLDIHPVHNVPTMKVGIKNGQATIKYLVHLHKPVIAFLNFRYTLINDPVSVDRKIRLKRGSFKYEERTRRLDLKAKAALAAVNIKELAIRELQDVAHAILKTLPDQLEKQSVTGELERIELFLDEDILNIYLAGAFERKAVEKVPVQGGAPSAAPKKP
ncbi:MAG: hypothetical protein BMS9Abin02_0220 [Anaerolineae bacterium]|nr:MAG: hypothetical protein BMS9Abin02_0220 [Anaerolineae bacterium]